MMNCLYALPNAHHSFNRKNPDVLLLSKLAWNEFYFTFSVRGVFAYTNKYNSFACKAKHDLNHYVTVSLFKS